LALESQSSTLCKFLTSDTLHKQHSLRLSLTRFLSKAQKATLRYALKLGS